MTQNKNNNQIVNVMLLNYQSSHKRIIYLVKDQKINKLRLILVVGVLVCSCIINYYITEGYLFYIINLIIFLILPFILNATLVSTVTYILKVSRYISDLREMEDEINKVLESDAKHSLPDDYILEYWCYNHGYAKKKNKVFKVTIFTLITTIISLIVIVLMIILRIIYLIQISSPFGIYLYILIFMGLLLCILILF